MLKAENTSNNTGVMITGTYEDLDLLYEALATLVDPFSDEIEDSPLYNTALHVLSICYDLRHAYTGARELRLADNFVSPEIMNMHSMICPQQNVEYAFPTIWTEALFVVAALSTFIERRTRQLTKNCYIFREKDHFQLVFDKAITTVRCFQAVVMEAFGKLVGDAAYIRTAKLMVRSSGYVFERFCSEYLNMLSVKYLKFDAEKKKKNLGIFIKRVLEQGDEYQEMKSSITQYARMNNCSASDVRLSDTEFPEDIEW